MSDSHVELVREMWEAINHKDFKVIERGYAPDILYHEGNARELRGINAIREYIEGWFTAFPDAHVTVEDIIASGDRVVTRATARGTHTGPLGDIPPTGKRAEMAIISIMRVANGKIAEEWEIVDQMTMMQQLGLIPD